MHLILLTGNFCSVLFHSALNFTNDESWVLPKFNWVEFFPAIEQGVFLMLLTLLESPHFILLSTLLILMTMILADFYLMLFWTRLTSIFGEFCSTVRCSRYYWWVSFLAYACIFWTNWFIYSCDEDEVNSYWQGIFVDTYRVRTLVLNCSFGSLLWLLFERPLILLTGISCPGLFCECRFGCTLYYWQGSFGEYCCAELVL